VAVVLRELRRHHRPSAAHSLRVAHLAAAVAGERVFLPALLHDAGKLMVPARLLAAPRGLEGFERVCLREHAAWGVYIVTQAWGRRPPRVYRDVCAQHHERRNGTGYPRRLYGYQTCREALVAAAADVYDAMTTRTDRGEPATHATASRALLSRAPSHFDAWAARGVVRVARERVACVSPESSIVVALPPAPPEDEKAIGAWP